MAPFAGRARRLGFCDGMRIESVRTVFEGHARAGSGDDGTIKKEA
jgi:hypothetical protein